MCVCVFGNDIGVHTCHKYIGNTHHTHTYLFIHIHVLIDLNNVHVGHVYMFFSLGYKLYAVCVCVCVCLYQKVQFYMYHTVSDRSEPQQYHHIASMLIKECG